MWTDPKPYGVTIGGDEGFLAGTIQIAKYLSAKA